MFIWEQFTTLFKFIFNGFLALLVTFCSYFGLYFDIGGVYDGFGADYAYTFALSTEKVKQNDILDKKDTLQVAMGKNEREGLQFIARLRNSNDMRYTLELSEVKNGSGAVIPASLYQEGYILAGAGRQSGIYPDALTRYNGTVEVMARRKNQGYYIELRTDANTPAGIYNGAVTLRRQNWVDGVLQTETALEAPFTVEVLDVTFPNTSYNDSSVGLNSHTLYTLNGVQPGTPAGDALYKRYYDYMLDHKISPLRLPYDILDARADAYMSDPRVTSFVIP